MTNHTAPPGIPASAATQVAALRPTRLHPPIALIADPQEWSARSLESILVPDGYTVVRAGSGRQALEQASRSSPDLVFLVADLPDTDGVALCRRLREEGRIGASTPVLLLHGFPATRELRLAALRAGAWELVGLPLDAEELLLKLGSFLGAKLEAEAARAESLLDEGSGLYNVRGLLRRAREMGADARRYHRPLACAVFALEGAAGAAGSERIARLLRSAARGCDAVGRLGEREFVVLAPDTDRRGVLRLAQRLAQMVETSGAGEANGAAPRTLRAGCYAVSNFAAAGIEPVELLARAAQALRTLRESRDGEQIRFFESRIPAAHV